MRVPMTVLNDRLIEASLNRICEQPPAIPIRKANSTNQETVQAVA